MCIMYGSCLCNMRQLLAASSSAINDMIGFTIEIVTSDVGTNQLSSLLTTAVHVSYLNKVLPGQVHCKVQNVLT